MKLWRVLALSSLARTNAAHERPPLSESETRLDVGMEGAEPPHPPRHSVVRFRARQSLPECPEWGRRAAVHATMTYEASRANKKVSAPHVRR